MLSWNDELQSFEISDDAAYTYEQHHEARMKELHHALKEHNKKMKEIKKEFKEKNFEQPTIEDLNPNPELEEMDKELSKLLD